MVKIARPSREYMLFRQEHLCKSNKHFLTTGFLQSCEKISKYPFKPQQVEIDLGDKLNGSTLSVVLFSTLGALES